MKRSRGSVQTPTAQDGFPIQEKAMKTDDSDEYEYCCSDCGGVIAPEAETCPHCHADTSDLVEKEERDITGMSLTPPTNSEVEVKQFVPINAPIDYRYRGVGGWLMYFIISLVFLSPLSMAASLRQYDLEWSRFYTTYPFLKTINSINLVVGFGMICFSIYAGVNLWTIRPNAVHIAKIYLIVSAISSIMLTCLPLFAGFPERASTVFLQVFPVEMILLVSPTVWFLYLSKSKRVATTYTLVG